MTTWRTLFTGVLGVFLTSCVSLPAVCDSSFIGPRTLQERVDCLEARLTNTETMATLGLGLGVIGVATGVMGILAAKRVGEGLAAAQSGAAP